MPVSNYVIRRYTPPTCTLEILAQSSALSRWMGKSVLKQLRFELRFDDPQIPEEQRIAIRGDRDQLEALCAAVTNYVQEFLQQSAENVWASISEPQELSNISNDSAARNLSEQTNLKPFNTQMLSSDIRLQPNSRLTHKLLLGSLANHISGPVIQLSLLQLFDLANALDEYSVDVVALPTINTESRDPSLATWASVAAVLVLGLALTPLTWQYANRLRQEQVAKKPISKISDEQIALSPQTSSLSQPTPIPSLTPPDSLPSVPLSSTLPSSSSKSGTIGSLSTQPGLPPAPPKSIPLTQTSPKFSTLSHPLASSGSTLTIPGISTTTDKTLPTVPPSTLLSKLPDQQVNIQSHLGQNSTGLLTKNKFSAPQTSSGLSPSYSRTTTNSITPNISPKISSVPPPLTTIPELNSDTSRSVTGTNSSITGNSSLLTKLRQARQTTPTNVVSTTTGTLFDITPQIAEAREFLKKHWQPPEGLNQTMQYSLLVGIDGTIERIFPLNKAARDYIDRTGMPLIGERFISPNRNGQSVKIRAVYTPDGKVQTFPETD